MSRGIYPILDPPPLILAHNYGEFLQSLLAIFVVISTASPKLVLISNVSTQPIPIAQKTKDKGYIYRNATAGGEVWQKVWRLDKTLATGNRFSGLRRVIGASNFGTGKATLATA
jgi:hypothetical protein